jgi:hypothetical protein
VNQPGWRTQHLLGPLIVGRDGGLQGEAVLRLLRYLEHVLELTSTMTTK